MYGHNNNHSCSTHYFDMNRTYNSFYIPPYTPSWHPIRWPNKTIFLDTLNLKECVTGYTITTGNPMIGEGGERTEEVGRFHYRTTPEASGNGWTIKFTSSGSSYLKSIRIQSDVGQGWKAVTQWQPKSNVWFDGAVVLRGFDHFMQMDHHSTKIWVVMAEKRVAMEEKEDSESDSSDSDFSDSEKARVELPVELPVEAPVGACDLCGRLVKDRLQRHKASPICKKKRIAYALANSGKRQKLGDESQSSNDAIPEASRGAGSSNDSVANPDAIPNASGGAGSSNDSVVNPSPSMLEEGIESDSEKKD